MIKRVLIATGGTGGHIYPAQGLVEQLKALSPEIDILFIGGGLATNRYFDSSSYPFHEVTCSAMNSAVCCFKIAKGTYQSYKIIKAFKPDILVGFGSYYTVPPLLAAKLTSLPIVLYEANSIPGKVIKGFSPYVNAVGIHIPQTAPLLQGEIVEVGMPLRKSFSKELVNRNEALSYFNLGRDKQTLLVFGGSQGAEAINLLIKRSPPPRDMQVIHLSGSEERNRDLTELYRARKIEACVKAFEPRMHLAWGAADLFVGRSGAGAIAEALEFEVPGILIPYPQATDNHQERNADYLATTVGGAIKLLQQQLTPQQFSQLLERLKQPELLEEMRHKMRCYKNQPSRISLGQLVLKTAEKAHEAPLERDRGC